MAPLKTKQVDETPAKQEQTAEPAVAKKPNPRAGKFRIDVYDAWCKQCGLCVDFCPKKTLTIKPLESPEATYPENCIGCMLCVLHCPDFAISVSSKEDTGDKSEEEANGG